MIVAWSIVNPINSTSVGEDDDSLCISFGAESTQVFSEKG